MTDIFVNKIPLPAARPENADGWRLYETVKETPDIWSHTTGGAFGTTGWKDMLEMLSQFASRTEYPNASNDYFMFEILMMMLGLGIIVVLGWTIYEGISWIVRNIRK